MYVVAKTGDFLTGASSIVSDVKTLFDPKAGLWDKIKVGIGYRLISTLSPSRPANPRKM